MIRKRLYIVLIYIFVLLTVSCETSSSAIDPPANSKPAAEAVKLTIPMEDRRFIYNNGIKAEYKEVKSNDENKVEVTNYYPVISGLKNKAVQDKINAELQETGMKLLDKLEASFLPKLGNNASSISQKRSDTYISYNFNNVIFVEYSAYLNIDDKTIEYMPTYHGTAYGYDLNTGEKIKLADIFKPGSDFKTTINNYICQFIIESNYDDYEANRMSKPFQGIREDQSFSFGLEGLRIILDEKNDEFVLNGYSNHIFIPIKSFGDDLYIFDKYFDEDNSIFEKEKLSKKLFPNQIEFKPGGVKEERNEKYYISITQGEFINVPDQEIEKKLNELVAFKSNIEEFKQRTEALTGINENAYFAHYINIFTNAGGYLSMAVADEIYLKDQFELKRTPFNYDFNLHKEMQLSDIFVEGTDIAKLIKPYVKKMNYSLTEEILASKVEEVIKDSVFYFDEYGISIHISQEDTKANRDDSWVWIPFEELGLEKIKFLN